MVGHCWASLFSKVSTGVNMKVPGCFYTYCVCVCVCVCEKERVCYACVGARV